MYPVVAVDFGYTDVPVGTLGPDRVIGSFAELPDAIADLAIVEKQDGRSGLYRAKRLTTWVESPVGSYGAAQHGPGNGRRSSEKIMPGNVMETRADGQRGNEVRRAASARPQ